MDVAKITDFLIELLNKVVDFGNAVFDWFTADITIGTWTFKPLYIGIPVIFALLALWLKNKIMGDLG